MICCTENFAKQFKTLIISLFPWGKKHTGNPRTYRRQKPVLYLSVNAQALDNNGLIHEYLKQKNIPLALWFVDNVWNILSRFSQAWWKECAIFLTDFSFASQLRKEGAKKLFPFPSQAILFRRPMRTFRKFLCFLWAIPALPTKTPTSADVNLSMILNKIFTGPIQKIFRAKRTAGFSQHSANPAFSRSVMAKQKLQDNKLCRDKSRPLSAQIMA